MLTGADHAAAALAGAETGTLFHPTGRRRPTRLLWLAHATEPKGRLVLDAGAVRAVTERRASLLPAGITGVQRRVRGRRPRRPRRRRQGSWSPAGWSTTTPTSCPALLGRSTRELARELGAAYEREVVHRDDLWCS